MAEPSFFTGDLEQFAWSKLMDARMGNQEKMNQYGEALVKFSEAKQLPELFRTIFRSAFLPYRSPETLGLFLKEISYFDYTHPEELNASAYEVHAKCTDEVKPEIEAPAEIETYAQNEVSLWVNELEEWLGQQDYEFRALTN